MFDSQQQGCPAPVVTTARCAGCGMGKGLSSRAPSQNTTHHHDGGWQILLFIFYLSKKQQEMKLLEKTQVWCCCFSHPHPQGMNAVGLEGQESSWQRHFAVPSSGGGGLTLDFLPPQGAPCRSKEKGKNSPGLGLSPRFS